MFSILVNEKGGESKRLDFDKPEVTIGRVQGNDIILPKGNVSKRHSRIVLKDGKFIIVDLKSTNGTYVNGRKITSPLVVKNTDKIYIGDFILTIDEAGAAAPAPEPPAAEPPARPRTMSSANVPPPPPRRLADEEGTGGGEVEGDSTLGAQEPQEPVPEPLRRPPPAQPVQPMRPAPAPSRPPEPVARPASRADIPAIAPSRPAAAPAPRPTPSPVASAPPPAAPPPVAPRPRPISSPPVAAPAATPAPIARRPAPVVDGDVGRRGRIVDAMRALSQRVVATLGDELHRLHGDALRERVESAANELVGDIANETGLPPGIEPDQLLRDVVAETAAMGPLEELMQDESVYAITISRPDRIYVDRAGQARSLSPRVISSADAVHRILDRVAARAGRLADLAEAKRNGGVFEARLDGGFALTAVIGPMSASGASVIVRRARRDAQRLTELASSGILSAGMADFLDLAVRARRNIVVAGAAGSGRSTVLGALLRAAEGQRVALVEESLELDPGDAPWISISGAGGDARRAFSAALRMKPERVAIGDVRGAEALDVVAAMAGGLDGVVLGVTAASGRDALARLAAAARMAGDAPAAATIDAEIGAGVHVVVTLGRSEDVRVAEIAEVSQTAEGPAVTAIFSLRGEGAGARFQASGHVPPWAEGAPASMFRA